MNTGQASLNTSRDASSFLVNTFEPWLEQEYRERIYWSCNQVTGSRILDVGCGTQLVTALTLAKRGCHIVAIDSDERVIELAQKELSVLPESLLKQIELVNTDLEALAVGLPFDTVVLGHILHEFAEPQRVLSDLLELLPPDGKIVVTVPYGTKVGSEAQARFDLPTFQDLIPDALSVETLDVADLNIRAVLRYDRKTKRYKEDELLDVASRGLIQARLYDTRKSDWTERAIEKRNYNIRKLDKKVIAASSKINKLEARNLKLKAKISQLEAERERFRKFQSHLIVRILIRVAKALRPLRS